MLELYQCIPGEYRDKNSPENPYCSLIQQLLGHNFLEYDFHLTSNLFFEMIVRYSDFFKDSANFFTTAINWFFSPQGARNGTKAIASQAINLFLRLMQKIRQMPNFAAQAELIAQHLLALITDCENGQISADVVGEHEI